MEETTAWTILLMAKVGAMIGLGFGSLILGMLPLMVGRCRIWHRQKRCREISSNSSNSTSTSTSHVSSSIVDSAAESQGLITSLLLCFGGGVLLFTTFLHLAPEIRVSVEIHQSNGQLPTLGTLSLAELLFCGGFFFVYLVEEAVHAALTGKPESTDALLYRTVSVRRCNNQSGGVTTSVATSGSTTTVSTTTRSTWKEESDEEDCERSKQHAMDSDACGVKDDKVLPAIFVLSSPDTDRPEDSKKVHRFNPELPVYQTRKHHEHHTHMVPTKNTSIQGLLTVLALSFHAIFEGLAVGLEPSLNSVVYLAAAIATHKLVIAFCVGMELYVAGASTRTTLGYLSIFSMVTPIGIAVGFLLGHFKNDSDTLGPTPTILQGMAAGTLLYVVFFEVLARERANEKSGLLQLLAIIVGFMLMLSLQIATAHSHSHGGHEHDHEDKDDIHEHKFEKELNHAHMNEGNTEKVLSGTIETVTHNIMDVLSTTLSSSSQSTQMLHSGQHEVNSTNHTA